MRLTLQEYDGLSPAQKAHAMAAAAESSCWRIMRYQPTSTRRSTSGDVRPRSVISTSACCLKSPFTPDSTPPER